jgi:hypothetical protein
MQGNGRKKWRSDPPVPMNQARLFETSRVADGLAAKREVSCLRRTLALSFAVIPIGL